MKYHGAQPCQGVEPGELYTGVEKVAMHALELLFVSEPSSMDHRWARLGALQIHLERGMTATRRTVDLALKDCKLLEIGDYGGQWRREDAFRLALKETRKALELINQEPDERVTYCNLLVDLGRDKLIPPLMAKEIEKLRSRG